MKMGDGSRGAGLPGVTNDVEGVLALLIAAVAAIVGYQIFLPPVVGLAKQRRFRQG